MESISYEDKSEKTVKEQKQFFDDIQINRFRVRLKTLIDEYSSIREFAKVCDLSDRVVRDYLSGKTTPSLGRIVHIAKAAGCHFQWLATGEGPRLTKDKQIEGFTDKADNFVYMSVMQTGGSQDSSSVQLKRFAFREDWVKRKGLDRGRPNLLYVKGDNMSPTLKDGDMILINQYLHQNEQHQFKYGLDPRKPELYDTLEPGLYLTDYFGFTVMRIEPDGKGGIYTRSDNPSYPMAHIEKDKLDLSKIIGKVVWFCRSL